MPKLPILSGRETIKILQSLGFEVIRQRGSHVLMRHGETTCVVPMHNPIKSGTLRSVLRQANVDIDAFIGAYMKR